MNVQLAVGCLALNFARLPVVAQVMNGLHRVRPSPRITSTWQFDAEGAIV